MVDTSTKLNAVQSPFLRLPAEIRNLVYHHLFCDAVYQPRFEMWNEYMHVMCPRADNRFMLRVCRQIHHETALLPYRMGIFDFAPPLFPMRSKPSKRWRWELWGFMKNRSRAQIMALARVKVLIHPHGGVGDSWTRLEQRGDKVVSGTGPYWAAKLGLEGYSS